MASGFKVPWLQLKGVTRRFGKAEVLSGIDLSLGADEMLVVLGPTGAGKTTLLRIVAGLDAPDAGQVEMNGEEVTHWPPAERDIALVFQHFALYPDWSVRRNLEFPLKAPRQQLASGEIDQRVGWAAELLKIERLLDRPAARLSGGEMQRVAIGQAIVRRPRLFLFDEPLTNLDAKLRESLRLELALLRQELGIPAIYVTHDQAEALSMGDSIAVLAEGTDFAAGQSGGYLSPAGLTRSGAPIGATRDQHSQRPAARGCVDWPERSRANAGAEWDRRDAARCPAGGHRARRGTRAGRGARRRGRWGRVDFMGGLGRGVHPHHRV